MAMSSKASTLVVNLTVLLLTLVVDRTAAKNMFCYATNWPQYRPEPAKFVMSDIDASKCTHLVFAFAKVSGYELAPYEYNDGGPSGSYMQFTNLKYSHPGLKTLLAVGGWTHGGQPFTTMTETADGRAYFVRTTIDYLRNYNFDGLDIDWEYPTAYDKPNLVLLLQELRTAFDAEAASTGNSPLLLAMAVAAGLQNAEPGYDVPALNQYLDFINVMTYDYHGAWEDFTGLLAPLNAPTGDTLSMTITLDWYTQEGASKEKLNVGLALYGRSWILNNPADTSIGAPASNPGPAGQYTREPGVLAYYEICTRINDYTVILDPLGQINYAYKGSEWITFEDPTSLGLKSQFIIDNNYGGAMIWAFDLDDFDGYFCNEGRYPLISEVSTRILNAGSSPTTATPPPVITTAAPIPLTTAPPPVTQPPTTAAPPPESTTAAPPPVIITAAPIPVTTPSPTVTQPPSLLPPSYGSIPAPLPVVPESAASSLANRPAPAACPLVPEQIQQQEVPDTPFSCPATNGQWADPNSCQQYYLCLFAMPFRQKCPDYSHYNPSIESCECIATSSYVC